MSKFFLRLSIFKAIASEGIRFWANTPQKYKLRLDKVHKTPYPVTRLVKIDLPDNQVDFVEKTFMHDQNLPTIELSFWENRYKRWYPCSIVIDSKKQEIDYAASSPFLFDLNQNGSGMIGVVIFSIPIAILCLPYIITARLYHKMLEKNFGISRHSQAILNALKKQLDPETKRLLITAMKNSWQHEKFMNKKLTFEEAQLFLDKTHLIKHVYPSEEMTEIKFLWFNDKGDLIARAEHDYRIADSFIVSVLGSWFTKKEAEVLLTRYKTIKTKEYR